MLIYIKREIKIKSIFPQDNALQVERRSLQTHRQAHKNVYLKETVVNVQSLEIVISHLESSSSETCLDFIIVFCILLLREAHCSCIPWVAFGWWVASTTPPSSRGGGEGRFAAWWADFLLNNPVLTWLLEGGLETVLLSSSCCLYLYAKFLLLKQHQLDFFVSACSSLLLTHQSPSWLWLLQAVGLGWWPLLRDRVREGRETWKQSLKLCWLDWVVVVWLRPS